MNAAQFLTFLFFLFRSYDPMRKLSRLQNSMEQALAAAHHVWEIMDEHAELPEKKDARELQPLVRAIELRNVSFGYANEERSVLREVSLKIPAGSMVALVGESGGGKSTLTKLLPRFHDPVSGGVFWDGVDLRDATISSLRRPDSTSHSGDRSLQRHACATTLLTENLTRRRRKLRRRRASLLRTTSLWSCRRSMKLSSASAAFFCRAASVSGWQSRARFWLTRRC